MGGWVVTRADLWVAGGRAVGVVVENRSIYIWIYIDVYLGVANGRMGTGGGAFRLGKRPWWVLYL